MIMQRRSYKLGLIAWDVDRGFLGAFVVESAAR